ncbi:Maf family protein [Iodobacter fluviatilis]|uniref:dTTP/UTP pyrophosphatase n=1 Tax=Iodobacter fluviatilis TaxID=537 RepID=A0A377SRW2_9NEIS|nr:Maf family protein [Iodobacter fluviatilis]TCU81639.1 septum formation protein [Iodobacter fluviatilis]STR44761.1 Maf-like protein yhdE [Iodobacter fluviatilis]
MPTTQLYLASGSPRRQELLAQIGVQFERISAPVDETPLENESARDYVLRLAKAKAEAGWQAMLAQGKNPLPVLAADTTVVLDGQILGKPLDASDAAAMLAQLSGRSHEVLTSLGLRTNTGTEVLLSVSSVTFMPLSPAQIAAYIASGEPMDKAGSYGIQGTAGLFISDLQGSFSGVMGLPLHDTATLLARHGLGLLAVSA